MHVHIQLFRLILVLGVLCCGSARADSPIKLSIVPEDSYEKGGAGVSTIAPFYVVALNQSDKPVRVWREWCSWGYFALSLEGRSLDSSVLPIKKKPRDWFKNFPDYFLIRPGEYFVMPVKLKDEWQGWEGYPAKETKLYLRARYKISADKESTQEGVWTGEVMSPWIEVTIY